MIINHAEVLAKHNPKRGGSRHHCLWARDDRDGFRDYVCVLCAQSFGLKQSLLQAEQDG